MNQTKDSRMEPTPTINIDPRAIVNCIKLLDEVIADTIDEKVGLGDPNGPDGR